MAQGQQIETKTQTATATFAGGCFWCMEKPFDATKGVVSTTSGYTGGLEKNVTYKQVSAGKTGHTEALQVVYDPRIVNYETLLNVYWRNVDPFDVGGQFCDRGQQYRPEIFVYNEEQKKLAEKSKRAMAQELGRPIVVAITDASTFYDAEGYHQDYYKKNPLRYGYYRFACGRDRRLESIWGEK